MKNSFKYIIGGTLSAAALLLSSCSLDEYNPHAGDATLDNFEAWAGMQATCYYPLVDDNGLYSRSDFLFASEGGTDLWVHSKNGTNNRECISYEQLATAKDAFVKLWRMGYQTISTCNTIINEAGNLGNGDPDVIKTLVAETKALRAFYYSILVAYYGPVTLNLESSSAITGNVDLYPVRTDEKTIYDQIIKDLTEAIADLPIQPYQNNRARISKKSAKGILARVYAQRAGLGDKFYGDGPEYWKLAKDTAEDLIKNQAAYGVKLYPDIADMWADANNRHNEEALFQTAGADPNDSESYQYESGRFSNLCVYAGSGLISETDFFTSAFANYRPDRGTSYLYGRQNVNYWQPSRYLLYCFNPEWDRRWEYTWIYSQSDYTFLDWGLTYDGASFEWTQTACDKYGVDPQHIGKKARPFAQVGLYPTQLSGTNQYDIKIWPKNATGNTSELLRVANNASEIGNAGVYGATKALANPYPVAADDERVKVLFVHDRLSAADIASRPYVTFCIDDLYVDTYPYGDVNNGSAANYMSKGTGNFYNGNVAPCFHKFNWSFVGCFTGNMQRKTGDIYIIRLAEMYLIAAEACQKLGDGGTAAGYLNKLRERAKRPGYTGNWQLSNATEDDVLDEYAREMCGEFTRWILLKRHNNIAERLALHNKRAAKAFKPYMYNRPISQDFLDVILNATEYGDNGYGATGASGLAGFNSYN